MTQSTTSSAATASLAPETPVRGRRRTGLVAWWRNPWRKPWILGAFTVGYLAWSLLPVLVAVLFSFNAGRSRVTWQGFSMRWYYGDPLNSVWHDPSLHTALTYTLWLGLLATVITVPLGVAMALGLDRWRGRIPSGANFAVIVTFVLPEILIAVSLLFVATVLVTPVRLGTPGQVIGLVTYQLSYPVVIVRARLLTIGRDYEEAAIDLGASPFGAVRRVLLKMLFPAIFASAVLVFADVIDDFIIVRYLSGDSSTEPVSVKVYNTARAAPTPALNALTSLLLFASLLAVGIGWLAYRWSTRGESGRSLDVFTGEA
jgi:spermidine/putrescine transport system permease protein